MTTSILYATDVHGSEKCWKKFLRTGKRYKPDIMLMGGDLTGKVIAPIIKLKPNLHTCHLFGHKYELHDEKEIKRIEGLIRETGYYPYRCSLEEAQELGANKKKLDDLFDKLMEASTERWLKMVDISKETKVIVNPGNDDRFVIDHVIQESENVIYPLHKVVDLDEKHEMISCEWVNSTPWNSPRECSEKELMKKLEPEVARLDHFENAIFNFHCPPYDTVLDVAPKLDKTLKPKTFLGKPKMENVGSKSVRELIEKHQPLMGLHGHIHESAGRQELGKTTCINPGSDYTSGILYACLIKIDAKIYHFPMEV